MDNSTIYYAIYPQGNPTLILKGVENNPERIKKIRKNVEEKLNICFDQVGVIHVEKKTITLNMEGGELCINAVISVAYIAKKFLGKKRLKILSSSNVFKAKVSYKGIISLNFKTLIPNIKKIKDHSVYKLKGIIHIVRKTNDNVSYNELKNKLIHLKSYLPSCKAYGMINYTKNNKNTIEILPLINIKSENSYIIESSCGSGSICCSLNEFIEHRKSKIKVIQPSGGIIYTKIKNLKNDEFKIKLKSKATLISFGQI